MANGNTMQIVNVLDNPGSGTGEMTAGYVEVILLTDPSMYAAIKNATPTDVENLLKYYQIDISGAVAQLNNIDEAGVSNGGVDRNHLPQLTIMEACNTGDRRYQRMVQAYSEYQSILAELGAELLDTIKPKYEVASAKAEMVRKYFTTKETP